MLIQYHSELKSFPPEAHWFCPKRFDDDPIDYDNVESEEDMTADTKKDLITDAKQRHEVAYRYSLILGLDAEEKLLEDYKNRLNSMLKTCDKCVHGWQQGRKAYLRQLAG